MMQSVSARGRRTKSNNFGLWKRSWNSVETVYYIVSSSTTSTLPAVIRCHIDVIIIYKIDAGPHTKPTHTLTHMLVLFSTYVIVVSTGPRRSGFLKRLSQRSRHRATALYAFRFVIIEYYYYNYNGSSSTNYFTIPRTRPRRLMSNRQPVGG